jgi:signal transduction histidine kinase
LQDSNETKTKLFSIIGHDLRGPVGALQELLRLYADGDIETDEFLEFVPKLREDVDHISFTLNNLLSWGHTQMNGSVTKPSIMALESLVSENIKLLSEIAKKKSIKIVSELVENTLTWSDSNQIDIVVRNLISNALKFTPQNGMITISARERDNLWEVSIKDTGVGMDKITVKNLFEKNSNITTYGTANEKGTGLGLALCKEMVEKNGGSIWVESALRKGSCFFFTLPKREKSYSQAV